MYLIDELKERRAILTNMIDTTSDLSIYDSEDGEDILFALDDFNIAIEELEH